MHAFLNKLRGHKNRTFSWQAAPAQNEMLVVDLTTHRFCEVAIGDPIDRLSFLGPADNSRDQTEIYNYYRRGFYLVEDRGRLETVVFLLRAERNITPFVGNWLCNGRTRAITAQTKPKDVRWELGEPSQTEGEPTRELIWIYQFPGVEWEFAWTAEEELESVEMRLPES